MTRILRRLCWTFALVAGLAAAGCGRGGVGPWGGFGADLGGTGADVDGEDSGNQDGNPEGDASAGDVVDDGSIGDDLDTGGDDETGTGTGDDSGTDTDVGYRYVSDYPHFDGTADGNWTGDDDGGTDDDADLAWSVQRTAAAGARVVRLVGDGRADTLRLDFVDADNAETADPVGAVELWEDVQPYAAKGQLRLPRLFASQTGVVLLYDDPSAATMRLLVVDATDATHPFVVAHRSIAGRPSQAHGGFPGLPARDHEAVLVGSVLVIASDNESDREFVIVDLSDPARPRVPRQIRRPDAAHHGRLQRFGTTLVSWHAKPVGSAGERVAFHLERLSIGPTNTVEASPPVNIPGVPVAYQAAVLGTVDFMVEEHQGVAYDACMAEPKAYAHRHEGGFCATVQHEFNRLALGNDGAQRLNRYDIEPRRRIMDLIAADDDLFVMHEENPLPWNKSRPLVSQWRDVLSSSITQSFAIDFGWPAETIRWLGRGRRGRLVLASHGELVVVDAADRTNPPKVQSAALGGATTCRHVEIRGDVVLCALGELGLRAVNLHPG